MPARPLLLLATLLLAPLPALRAQDTTAHPGPFLIGAGMNLQGGSQPAPLALQLGREWRARDSRFGLRLTADYSAVSTGRRTLYSLSESAGFMEIGSESGRDRVFSLGAVTTFALAKGNIQPYVLSGFMYQRRLNHLERDLLAIDERPADYPPELPFSPIAARHSEYDTPVTSFGMQAGFGVQAKVRNVWVYSEVRTLFARQSYLPMQRDAQPIILGIRF